jgi:hypothetical protein
VNTTIETSNMSFAGYEVSIAIDHNDKVGIAYSDTQSGIVKYATNAGGSWVIENVTNASNFECSPSLAFDSAIIHISPAAPSALRTAWCCTPTQ